MVQGNRGKAHWEVVKWILQHLKGTLDVCLVYSANSRHTNLVGLIALDQESDLEIRTSLVVGLVQSLLLKVEKPIMFYDRLHIQMSGAKVNPEDVVTRSLPKEKFNI